VVHRCSQIRFDHGAAASCVNNAKSLWVCHCAIKETIAYTIEEVVLLCLDSIGRHSTVRRSLASNSNRSIQQDGHTRGHANKGLI